MSKEEAQSDPMMPVDLDGMAERLSDVMVQSLSPKQQERLCMQGVEHMSKKVRNEEIEFH